MLFGFGTGFFRKLSGQLPILMEESLKEKQMWIVGDGKGVKQHIHIEDAAGCSEESLRGWGFLLARVALYLSRMASIAGMTLQRRLRV